MFYTAVVVDTQYMFQSGVLEKCSEPTVTCSLLPVRPRSTSIPLLSPLEPEETSRRWNSGRDKTSVRGAR